jgi:hypothetical protein
MQLAALERGRPELAYVSSTELMVGGALQVESS